MKRWTTLAVGIVVAAVLGSCSSGKESSSSTTVPSSGGGSGVKTTIALAKPPCELLSHDEVAKAVGNPLKAPTPTGSDECFWATDVDGGTSIDVTARKANGSQAAVECTTLRRGVPSEIKQESIGGVGSSAFWATQKSGILLQGYLVACFDNGAIEVLQTGEKPADTFKATAVSIAQTVHSRI